jgi:hypothetical protein
MGANVTNAWAKTKQAYGVGGSGMSSSGWGAMGKQAQPMLKGLGVNAGGMGLGALLGNPLIGMILSNVGASLLERIFGGGNSPYEQMQAQQMEALKQQMPIIQAQAAGRPSAATQNQLAQLRQATTRAQQSYASTALGRNSGQSTPAKATQMRFRTAETQAMGDILGNAQLAAQQQLIGLGAAGAAGMRDIELQEAANRRQIYSDIASIMAGYRESQKVQNLDPQVRAMMQGTINMLGDFFKGQMANMQR